MEFRKENEEDFKALCYLVIRRKIRAFSVFLFKVFFVVKLSQMKRFGFIHFYLT